VAVGVQGADMVRKRWDVDLGARALRRGRRGFAACPHHHVVEGRHVASERGRVQKMLRCSSPRETGLFRGEMKVVSCTEGV
jgi:hypothetical protein